MGKKRVRHSAEFKAKVALEAMKGLKRVNELAGQYQVHPRYCQLNDRRANECCFAKRLMPTSLPAKPERPGCATVDDGPPASSGGQGERDSE